MVFNIYILLFLTIFSLCYCVQFNTTNLNCSFYENTNLSRLDVPFECEKYPVGMEIFLGIVFIIIVVGAIGGNFLVILAVGLVKKLQTPNNLLIVSLAFSDFFVSVLVMPVSVYSQMVRFRWPFSELFCDVYISLDMLFCTSSILNLCAISIDRYLVITKPMVYAVRRTPALMGGMIALAWFISILISIPPVIGWKEKFVPGKCEYSENLIYQIYATFGAFYIPLIIMLVLYYRIFKLARKMALEDAKRKVGSEQLQDEDQNISPATSARTNSGEEDSKLLRFQQIPKLSGTEQLNGSEREAGRRSISKNKMKKSKSSSDSKAITTLGVIMGCFTLCWLPFFIMQILKPILIVSKVDYRLYLLPSLWEFFLWLGYFNSFLNPVIYAKFNREFRTPFKQILMFHCAHINARLRSESYAEQYGLPSNKNAVNSHQAEVVQNTQALSSRRSSQTPFTPVSRKNKLRMNKSRTSQDEQTNV